jgi:DNA-binding IscR family transcriptional regulator
VWQRLAEDMSRVLASYTLKDLSDEARRKAADSAEAAL